VAATILNSPQAVGSVGKADSPSESNVNSPKELTQSNLGSHADSPKESAQPTPVAQPEASAPRPQAEEQGLNVPISHKQEIGASQQVSVASTQTQPNPVTRPVASAKAQVQSTPTAHKDVVGQAVGSVGGDVAVDVAKKLFGL